MPEPARQPYYVYARMAAAEETSDPGVRFTLEREALAIVPSDTRIRLEAAKTALQGGRDAIALAMAAAGGANFPVDAALANGLAGASERTGDLQTAATYLKTAIGLAAAKDRPPLEARLKAIDAELSRRAANRARQPVIKGVVDQDVIVRPRIEGGMQ
jgi:hypothetical protein